MQRYRDRKQAGEILAEQLKIFANRKDVMVLALPRGGVPVAYEIANALHVPLDVFIVRKLGVPGQEELAMGAIAMGGTVVFNQELVKSFNISKSAIESVIEKEQIELNRRELLYRDNRPFPKLMHKTVILVDDGIATGATMRAAVKALTQLKPAMLVIAVPVAETTMCEQLSGLVDQIVCPLKPHNFTAVGAWYEDFNQTTDTEVRELLKLF